MMHLTRPMTMIMRRQLAFTRRCFSRSPTPSDAMWRTSFEALCKLVEKEGHKTISDKKLREWLSVQRSEFREGVIPRERQALIEKLGISLVPAYQTKWEQHYKSLKLFHKQHGHSNATIHNGATSELANFVQGQRRSFHRRGNAMSQQRISLLKQLDFEFQAHESKWHMHYQQLQEYYSQNGDSRVPQKQYHNPSLSRWVDDQRQHYRKQRSGKTISNSLTEERIKLLEEVDFCWSMHDARWQDQYEELEVYVRIHGLGCKVGDGFSVAKWLSNQEKMHRKLQRGDKVTLTPARLKKLQMLGYCL